MWGTRPVPLEFLLSLIVQVLLNFCRISISFSSLDFCFGFDSGYCPGWRVRTAYRE